MSRNDLPKNQGNRPDGRSLELLRTASLEVRIERIFQSFGTLLEVHPVSMAVLTVLPSHPDPSRLSAWHPVWFHRGDTARWQRMGPRFLPILKYIPRVGWPKAPRLTGQPQVFTSSLQHLPRFGLHRTFAWLRGTAHRMYILFPLTDTLMVIVQADRFNRGRPFSAVDEATATRWAKESTCRVQEWVHLLGLLDGCLLDADQRAVQRCLLAGLNDHEGAMALRISRQAYTSRKSDVLRRRGLETVAELLATF